MPPPAQNPKMRHSNETRICLRHEQEAERMGGEQNMNRKQQQTSCISCNFSYASQNRLLRFLWRWLCWRRLWRQRPGAHHSGAKCTLGCEYSSRVQMRGNAATLCSPAPATIGAPHALAHAETDRQEIGASGRKWAGRAQGRREVFGAENLCADAGARAQRARARAQGDQHQSICSRAKSNGRCLAPAIVI